MELAPAVIGVLCVIAVGIVLTIVAVTTCFVCNTCCRDGKSRCSIYYQPEVLPAGPQSVSVVPNRTATQTVEVEGGTRTLKDSVLSRDAPPTYHMATEYPRVYAGQYYIGMSGQSDVQTWTSSNENLLDPGQPPDYHLVVPK